MVLKASQLSPAAQRARTIKKSNRPLRPQIVKRTPQPLPDLEVPALPIDDLDALSPASRKKLERVARDELLFRMNGGREPVKLSKTFEEVANDLGVTDAREQEALLRVVFQYAIDHYRSPRANKPLSALKHSVLKILIEEDHTSPFEIGVHDPDNWGRRNSGSLTSRISEWGHLDKVSQPVYIKSQPQEDVEHINGVGFTYYSLSEEFKRQLIIDAVSWDAERLENALLSQETHDRIAALD